MDVANIAAAPYRSFRHARLGRVGEAGCLPPGWRGEHLDDIRVLDIGSRGEPWVTIGLRFAANIPGDFAGLGLGPSLPAPRGAAVALGAQVTLHDWDNLAASFMVVREWRPAGVFAGQSIWSIPISTAARAGGVSRKVAGDGGAAEAVFMIRRRAGRAGHLTVTLRGLAFGILGDHPSWRPPVAGGE